MFSTGCSYLWGLIFLFITTLTFPMNNCLDMLSPFNLTHYYPPPTSLFHVSYVFL